MILPQKFAEVNAFSFFCSVDFYNMVDFATTNDLCVHAANKNAYRSDLFSANPHRYSVSSPKFSVNSHKSSVIITARSSDSNGRRLLLSISSNDTFISLQ